MIKSQPAHHSQGAHLGLTKLPATAPETRTMKDAVRGSSSGYFSALVHEVRNPLCNIKLACDVLNLTKLDEEQRACLNIVIRGSTRINELINTLLDFDGIEAPKYARYSLRQLLEDVLIMAGDRILLKRIEVAREYAAPEDGVFLDIEKMKIALINIVNNAIDAMPSEKGKLRVVTRSAGQSHISPISRAGWDWDCQRRSVFSGQIMWWYTFNRRKALERVLYFRSTAIDGHISFRDLPASNVFCS